MSDPHQAVDLAGATRDDMDRLKRAEAELSKKDAARKAAEDQRDAAKAAVLEAVMAGRTDSRAAEALGAANAALATAIEVRDLHAEGVAKIREQVADAVRQSRAAPIRAALVAERAAYDQKAQLLLEVLPIAESMEAHRAREAQLADQLAEVLRQPSGNRYRTIPDATLGFYVIRDRAREDVASVPHLSDKLRRGEGA